MYSGDSQRQGIPQKVPLRCRNLDIVSRNVWKARPEKPTIVNLRIPIPHVFIHHTETGACSNLDSCSNIIRDIQQKHQQRSHDIGFHFLIAHDNKIYEGRHWHYRGFIVDDFNSKSISIAYIGNYTNFLPTRRMIDLTEQLLQCLTSQNFLAPFYELHGHRDANPTFCPGDALYNEIQSWNAYKPGPLL
ncbi:Peptidoglycan-recognition protein SC2-like protein [Leptotrombidium deliense]|uniref:Peptidoglycan-recognition protein SC2-like protein n=1 Tax=Leptotrombidium deliense TaxID=299467 RepID=A0A443SIG9_9ACAR|nr:Peptidoglycan-recognition protein SC2-like protein [Leptotrombidium deliense]